MVNTGLQWWVRFPMGRSNYVIQNQNRDRSVQPRGSRRYDAPNSDWEIRWYFPTQTHRKWAHPTWIKNMFQNHQSTHRNRVPFSQKKAKMSVHNSGAPRDRGPRARGSRGDGGPRAREDTAMALELCVKEKIWKIWGRIFGGKFIVVIKKAEGNANRSWRNHCTGRGWGKNQSKTTSKRCSKIASARV